MNPNLDVKFYDIYVYNTSPVGNAKGVIKYRLSCPAPTVWEFLFYAEYTLLFDLAAICEIRAYDLRVVYGNIRRDFDPVENYRDMKLSTLISTYRRIHRAKIRRGLK